MPDRAATALLEAIGSKLWGFKPNLMRHFVAQHGPLKAVAWFAKNMPKYEKILKKWGPIRTHLIATAISTINGCPYCTYGHAKAFQLHYLKEHDTVFPIDEDAMVSFHRLGSAEVVERFAAALGEAGQAGEVARLRRMLELFEDQSLASTDSDKDLLQLINMFAALNVCGITSDAEVDEVHDPINRDIDLRDRYAELRS